MSVCKLTGWDGFCVPCAKFFYSKKTQEQHIRMMYYRALTILVKKVQKEFLQLGAQENFGITNRGIFKETLRFIKILKKDRIIWRNLRFESMHS